MEGFDIVQWIVGNGGIAGLCLVLLWLQRVDYKEQIKKKDTIIENQAKDSKGERAATFEMLGALKMLMEKIYDKL